MKLTHADDDAWAPTTTAVLAAAVMAFFYWLRELIRCFELVIADPCIGCGSLGSEEGRGLRDVFIPQVRSQQFCRICTVVERLCTVERCQGGPKGCDE